MSDPHRPGYFPYRDTRRRDRLEWTAAIASVVMVALMLGAITLRMARDAVRHREAERRLRAADEERIRQFDIAAEAIRAHAATQPTGRGSAAQ